MGSHMKKSIGGSIHRIREFELEKVNLAEEFDILQIVGEGWFGKILLVEHRATDTEMVLKALPKAYTALRDFYREFHYGLHLSAHRNVITTYDVAFETAGFYVFSQEYAPLGDLTSNVTENGIGELHTKRVARQLAAALDHLHARELVHRDVKLDNILVFKSDFSRIKLCDFGETRRTGTVVRRRNEWLSYAPPEILETDTDDNYKAVTSHDVWQFGIVIFVCLTGCLPWQKAASDDPRFQKFITWHSSAISPIRKQPKLFKLVSSKAQRLFRKLLEPKPEKRPTGLTEIHRYLDDRWMAKGVIEKSAEKAKEAEDDGLCPSMYSFHSSPEEKNKLLFTLTQYGIETTVDRAAKKDRIRAWIQNSVIEEEDEKEDQNDELNNFPIFTEEENEENIALHDNETGPAGERIHNRGPIENRRLSNTSKTPISIPSKPDLANKQAPILPPRKSEKRSRRHRLVMEKENKIYRPPIDPTVPLDKQKSEPTNLPNTSHSAQNNPQRNPNAFLLETNSSPTNINVQVPQQNIATYESYLSNYSNSSSLTATSNLPKSFNNTPKQEATNGIVTTIKTQNPQSSFSYSSVQNGSQSYNNHNNNTMHSNGNQQYSFPHNQNNSLQIPSNPPPGNPSFQRQSLKNGDIHPSMPPQTIPNLQSQNRTKGGISNALANSALVAISGVNVRPVGNMPSSPRPVLKKPPQPITEKEKDRNYNVYGINLKEMEHPSNSPGAVKRSPRPDNRHVTFVGAHSSGSGSK